MLAINKLLPPLSLLIACLVASCTNGDSNNSPNTSTDVEQQQQGAASGAGEITVLETNVDGGPELTNDGIDDAGIHLRQFYAWTDSEQARLDLKALAFTDGGDRSAFADVLAAEGGTLIALFPGLQSSTGVVDSNIESISIADDRMSVLVRSQVVGNCSADDAFSTPFRILHISDATAEVQFRELITHCIASETLDNNSVGEFTIDFNDNFTAQLQWIEPVNADDQTRYDVIDTGIESGLFDSTDNPTYTLTGIVPSVIYTRLVVPVDGDGNAMSQGTSIAYMVDAPSSLFGGRATLEDFERLKAQFGGIDAKDCGIFGEIDEADNAVTEVSNCIDQALKDGVAFTADKVIPAEGFTYQSLVVDDLANGWLLEIQFSDVPISNSFAPSKDRGGNLSGDVCPQPALLPENSIAQFTC